MNQPKEQSRLVLYGILAIAILGAILVMSKLDGGSGSSWDSLSVFFDQQEEASRVADGRATINARRDASNDARDFVREQRVRQITTLQARLNRMTGQYNNVKGKYDALTAMRGGSGADLDNQIEDLVANLESETSLRPTNADSINGTSADPSGLSVAELNIQLADLTGKLETAELLTELQDEQLERLQQLQTAADEDQQEMEQEMATILDEEKDLQSVASRALISFGSAAVPVLTDALEDRRAYVREWAADVLGSLGSDASDARPALVRALSDQNEFVRLAARRALNTLQNRENGDN